MNQPIGTKPPEWPLRLMRTLLKPEYLEEIEGDMEELFYHHVTSSSPGKARRIYTLEMLKLLRPSLLRSFRPTPVYHHHAMYRNYLKVSYRNLLKKKAYSFINTFGLALGIACCLLIVMYVSDELSYDNYHENKHRIYRITHGEGDEGNAPRWVWGNAPVGPALKNDFPEIDKIVQFSGRSDILLTYGEKIYQEEGVFFMDSTVFDVFSWPLIKGNPKTALAAPFTIVLTESTARKYFGDEDPLGKAIKGSSSPGRSNEGDYTVTGVMADVPANSHFRFNALLSLSTFRISIPEIFDAWGYVDFYTYFLVNEQFDATTFKSKIPAFLERHREYPESQYFIKLESLGDAYLNTRADRQPGETGSLANLYLFSVIGVFILLVAIINFVNLSTARSMERAKEVGIRKSIGAIRTSLVAQFLGESMIIVFIASVLAVLIVSIALPQMSSFTGKELAFTSFLSVRNIAWFIAAILIIGTIGGAYPAFVLSAFNPVLVMKGLARSAGGGENLRKGLVVFQFTLSVALIAGTMIVYYQMNHLLDKDLGFDREQMLVLDYNYDELVNDKSEVLKAELEKHASVVSVAFSRSVPGSYFPNAGTEIEAPDGTMQMRGQPIFQVGIDFIDHFGIKLIAGRSYSRDMPNDSSQAIIVNEAAARQYGYSNPADIVGKKFSQWGRSGEVIGVAKDFNFTSLHRRIEPLTMPFVAYASRYLSVKIRTDNVPATLDHVEKVWKNIAPHRPFLYHFLDDNFNRQYASDFIFRRLFTLFACLAILIACLGLLGLATYTAQKRTKEIGVRKVLGADVSDIVHLLSGDFVKLIAIAILIATPISWYGMNKWLEGFAYRIGVEVWVFIVAGAAAMLMAVVTVSYQAIKAALSNPVSCLRSE